MDVPEQELTCFLDWVELKVAGNEVTRHQRKRGTAAKNPVEIKTKARPDQIEQNIDRVLGFLQVALEQWRIDVGELLE